MIPMSAFWVALLVITGFASSVFAQGTVIFNNRIYGSLITHVYLGSSSQFWGNGPDDTPPGNMDWTGFTPLSGSRFSTGLLAGPWGSRDQDLVFQTGSVTTFRTGAAAGNVVPLTVTLSNVPKDAPSAVFRMVVWDNFGGTVNTWDEFLNYSGPFPDHKYSGMSPVFSVNAIGGDINPAAVLTGLQTFNVYWLPEPSGFSLACLGAGLFLGFRRRGRPLPR